MIAEPERRGGIEETKCCSHNGNIENGHTPIRKNKNTDTQSKQQCDDTDSQQFPHSGSSGCQIRTFAHPCPESLVLELYPVVRAFPYIVEIIIEQIEGEMRRNDTCHSAQSHYQRKILCLKSQEDRQHGRHHALRQRSRPGIPEPESDFVHRHSIYRRKYSKDLTGSHFTGTPTEFTELLNFC